MRTAVLGHPTKFISRTEDQMGVGHNPYPHSIRRCPDYDKLENIKKNQEDNLHRVGGGSASP